MLLVVLLYREVVSVYTRAGGSYVVARENFGPRIAQVAAVALLIDYVVTVAVQIAAASAIIVAAFPAWAGFPASAPYGSDIARRQVLIMCYGNLRGIREAGKIFALPTYLFSGSVRLMIIVGMSARHRSSSRSRTLRRLRRRRRPSAKAPRACSPSRSSTCC